MVDQTPVIVFERWTECVLHPSICIMTILTVGQVDHPLQSVNSVFLVAILCSFLNLLLVLFVFPESLPPARRAANRKGKNRAVEGHEFVSSGKYSPLSQGTRD
jgi:hypothetical protein